MRSFFDDVAGICGLRQDITQKFWEDDVLKEIEKCKAGHSLTVFEMRFNAAGVHGALGVPWEGLGAKPWKLQKS